MARRQSEGVPLRCESAAREGIMFSGRFDGGPKEKFLRAVAVRTCGFHSCYGCALLIRATVIEGQELMTKT